ncbi:putative galacturonosyltransferase 14 [Asimina triloba]
MQLRISPSMRSITISSSGSSSSGGGGGGNDGLIDFMKIKVAARHISYRTLFHTILILAFLLPFVFILTAVVTLEGVNKCSSLAHSILVLFGYVAANSRPFDLAIVSLL